MMTAKIMEIIGHKAQMPLMMSSVMPRFCIAPAICPLAPPKDCP